MRTQTYSHSLELIQHYLVTFTLIFFMLQIFLVLKINYIVAAVVIDSCSIKVERHFYTLMSRLRPLSRPISESAVGAGLVWGQVNVLLIYVLGVSWPLMSGSFSIWQQSVNLLHLLIYQHRKWLMVHPGAIKIRWVLWPHLLTLKSHFKCY